MAGTPSVVCSRLSRHTSTCCNAQVRVSMTNMCHIREHATAIEDSLESLAPAGAPKAEAPTTAQAVREQAGS